MWCWGGVINFVRDGKVTRNFGRFYRRGVVVIGFLGLNLFRGEVVYFIEGLDMYR